jgi:hypothetical protein
LQTQIQTEGNKANEGEALYVISAKGAAFIAAGRGEKP